MSSSIHSHNTFCHSTHVVALPIRVAVDVPSSETHTSAHAVSRNVIPIGMYVVGSVITVIMYVVLLERWKDYSYAQNPHDIEKYRVVT